MTSRGEVSTEQDRDPRIDDVTRLTPAQRTLRAQIAAHTSWANTTDRQERTQKARDAAQGRFEREVDPEGVLDPIERLKRAQNARTAFYKSMALKSAQARARRKAS